MGVLLSVWLLGVSLLSLEKWHFYEVYKQALIIQILYLRFSVVSYSNTGTTDFDIFGKTRVSIFLHWLCRWEQMAPCLNRGEGQGETQRGEDT